MGVIISEDLKCEKQCSEAVKKPNRMLGMIKRNFMDRSKETMVKVCDKSAAGFRRFCDLPTTENDVISEKET